ncbi:hypothetical protein EG329_014467 [Mollisiaceae sp. DMI_Dod_QoI]|nr:hypothetical protein EG329_014467 [Helotiales sp. DMI_Dod_QoI]
MNRQDSGYSDSHSPQSPATSSRRTSVASSTRRPRSPSKSKRRTTAGSGSGSVHSTSRPSTKRTSRSSAQIRTSTSGTRPTIQTRHTTPYAQTTHHQHLHQQYQFFHFPTLSDPVSDPEPLSNSAPPAPPPPPATIQYWTSDRTRRLEYAAIDAASKGVRGFFIRLVPDCILPKDKRRTRFHNDCDGNGDRASDAGSVRRYRLVLPAEEGAEEKGQANAKTEDCDGTGAERSSAGGLLRRWTFGRRV